MVKTFYLQSVYSACTMSKVSFVDVCSKFPTIEDCMANLESLRWQGQPMCPRCNSLRHTLILRERRYRCNNCDTNFSVMVNTLFHGTHVDLRKWYLLIALVMESRKVPAVRWLADQVQVNKNTITRMVRQIESAIKTDFNLLISITDEVIQDE